MRTGRRPLALDDAAHGQQHPLLVVADHARCARDHHELAAVDVDVGLEEAHLVLVGRPLDRVDELVQGGGAGLGPLAAR